MILESDVDWVSLIPAVFGALLSIYNWFMMNKPASIKPNKIIGVDGEASPIYRK